jgi:uncharacterized membrane protein
MSFYELFKLLHVLVAVAGLGLITAMALLAARTKPLAREPLLLMSRWSSAALVLMFLSGALMNLLAGGAYHETGWFRASALAIIVTGGVLAYGRRVLRKSDEATADRARRTIVRVSSLASVLVLMVTALMETKPF